MIILVKDFEQVQSGQYTNLEVKGINTKTQKETNQTIYSTLSDKWDLIEKDKMIELVMQNKGTGSSPRWQVTDIKLPPIAEDDKKTSKPENGQYKADPDKTASIERQVSLKCSVELAIAGTISREEILSWAKAFEGYLSGHIKVKDDDVFRKAILHGNLKVEQKED